uniref:Uncharacterized protein n=1 Tax=Rhizophora mucronata TaxID=61149 RepID=A0A2P2J972_RHIMU
MALYTKFIPARPHIPDAKSEFTNPPSFKFQVKATLLVGPENITSLSSASTKRKILIHSTSLMTKQIRPT